MSTLRMPHSLIQRLGGDAAEAALRQEMIEEQANVLGRAGAKVESTLQALRDHPGDEGRPAVLRAAAEAVWAFFVQREVMGLRDRAYIVAHYKIPRYIRFVDSFPMTVTGKIQKFQLREQMKQSLGLRDVASA